MFLTRFLVFLALLRLTLSQKSSSTESSTTTDRNSFPPLSEIDGNQFADQFNLSFCEGFFDIWEDPSIPDAERNNIGRAIYLTEEKVLQAHNLIEKGIQYNLGFPYVTNLTFALDNTYQIQQNCGVLGNPQEPVPWDVCFTQLSTEGIGNAGTQLDGMGHVYQINNNGEPVFFNNFKGFETAEQYLGIERLPFFFTRGILLDVPAFLGLDVLEDGYAITQDDILGTLAAQDIDLYDLEQGDAIFVYTGWDEQFFFQNEPRTLYDFNRAPGLLEEVFRGIFYESGAVVIGSDTIFVEVPLDNGVLARNHPFWMPCAGGFFHENVKLDEWVTDARQGKVPYMGAYLFQSLPISGGAAGGGRPIVMF